MGSSEALWVISPINESADYFFQGKWTENGTNVFVHGSLINLFKL